MKTILMIVLVSVFITFAGEKKTNDTTTVYECKCDTFIVVTTYKDTSVILKVDTLKVPKIKEEKELKKDKKEKKK